jgi:hypothetical protein
MVNFRSNYETINYVDAVTLFAWLGRYDPSTSTLKNGLCYGRFISVSHLSTKTSLLASRRLIHPSRCPGRLTSGREGRRPSVLLLFVFFTLDRPQRSTTTREERPSELLDSFSRGAAIRQQAPLAVVLFDYCRSSAGPSDDETMTRQSNLTFFVLGN